MKALCRLYEGSLKATLRLQAFFRRLRIPCAMYIRICGIYVCSYYCICSVLILFGCPHTSAYAYISSGDCEFLVRYIHICVYVCAHTTADAGIYVQCICVHIFRRLRIRCAIYTHMRVYVCSYYLQMQVYMCPDTSAYAYISSGDCEFVVRWKTAKGCPIQPSVSCFLSLTVCEALSY